MRFRDRKGWAILGAGSQKGLTQENECRWPWMRKPSSVQNEPGGMRTLGCCSKQNN